MQIIQKDVLEKASCSAINWLRNKNNLKTVRAIISKNKILYIKFFVLIVQDLRQTHYQILITILLECKYEQMIKNVRLAQSNTKTATTFGTHKV